MEPENQNIEIVKDNENQLSQMLESGREKDFFHNLESFSNIENIKNGDDEECSDDDGEVEDKHIENFDYHTKVKSLEEYHERDNCQTKEIGINQIENDKVNKEDKIQENDKTEIKFHFNAEKAGMEQVDKAKVNQIIDEASKGSEYYKREKERTESYQNEIKKKNC